MRPLPGPLHAAAYLFAHGAAIRDAGRAKAAASFLSLARRQVLGSVGHQADAGARAAIVALT